MKILFHLNSMGRGGAEHVVSILSGRFSAMGHEVIIATEWFSENEYPLDERVRRVHVGLSPEEEAGSRLRNAVLRLQRLRKCLRSTRPDLVISFCAKANFRSTFSLLGMGIPLIVSVRNHPAVDYGGHTLATKIMSWRASGCVFQTPDAMHWFSRSLQERSAIIFNPLAEEYLSAPPLRRQSADTSAGRIITVGRISRQKNQMLLVQAFEKIRDRYPDIRLDIFGDCEERDVFDSLTAYVQDHRLQDAVHFSGTTAKLREEFSRADLFVLPSDYEGMPNSLMEAMAMGLPCISTDCPCGGSRLLIADGTSGLLTPVGDVEALASAMDRILGDPATASSLGEEAAKIREQVHPDKICEEWLAFMKKLPDLRSLFSLS